MATVSSHANRLNLNSTFIYEDVAYVLDSSYLNISLPQVQSKNSFYIKVVEISENDQRYRLEGTFPNIANFPWTPIVDQLQTLDSYHIYQNPLFFVEINWGFWREEINIHGSYENTIGSNNDQQKEVKFEFVENTTSFTFLLKKNVTQVADYYNSELDRFYKYYRNTTTLELLTFEKEFGYLQLRDSIEIYLEYDTLETNIFMIESQKITTLQDTNATMIPTTVNQLDHLAISDFKSLLPFMLLVPPVIILKIRLNKKKKDKLAKDFHQNSLYPKR